MKRCDSHTRLLRRPTPGRFDAYGESFEVIDLRDGWFAAVCISAAPALCSNLQEWREKLEELQARWADGDMGRILKTSARGRVTCTTLAHCNIEVVCKDVRRTSFLQALGAWWSGPKPWREFWFGHRLRRAHLPTPLPVACLWRRTGALNIDARTITLHLANACGLEHAVRRSVRQRPAVSRALATAVGHVAARLGAEALYHRDFKASNLLVIDAESVNPQVWLIDLDGLHVDNVHRGKGYHRALARLAASLSNQRACTRTQCLRTLRATDAGASWKEAWSTIAAHAVALGARKLHRQSGKLSDYE
jgi:hypothetical protein